MKKATLFRCSILMLALVLHATPIHAQDTLLVSAGTDASAGVSASFFPNDAWGTTPYEPNDWPLTGATTEASLFIVPSVGSTFGAADFTLAWNGDDYSLVSVEETGGLFDGTGLFESDQLGMSTSVRINAARLDNANFTTLAGDYIAMVTLRLKGPGIAPVTLSGASFRSFDGTGGNDTFSVTSIGGEARFLLGDVGAPGDPSTGDGVVDFEDLSLWSAAYWSGVPGYEPGLTHYKEKYDIGPTDDGTVFGVPQPGATIDFEDLVIFSISYGLSGSGGYGKTGRSERQQAPVALRVDSPLGGGEVVVPVRIGTVEDLRAFSLRLHAPGYAFVRVEAGTLLPDAEEQPVFVTALASDGVVQIDGAVLGASVAGEGELVRLVLRGEGAVAGEVVLVGADLRDASNRSLTLAEGTTAELPEAYALEQNYPNPFNPSTQISFSLPEPGHVRLTLYDMLGREIQVLIDRSIEAGTHRVLFDAADLPSGTYLYRLETEQASFTRKMLLLR